MPLLLVYLVYAFSLVCGCAAATRYSPRRRRRRRRSKRCNDICAAA